MRYSDWRTAGLARKQAAYQAGAKSPTAVDLHRELNLLKKTNLHWMYQVSKCAPQEALRDLDAAYNNFFRRVEERKAGKAGKVGFPQFKSRKHGLGSFRLTGAIHVFESAIQLPRLGRLRLKERGYLPVSGARATSATVSEKAGHWFVSVQVEMALPHRPAAARPIAGVDLGVKELATVSDGTLFPNPHVLQEDLRKVKRLQRAVSRKVRGSANRKKAARRLALAHRRVAQVRENALHQITAWLTKTKSSVGLEDLNVQGMLQNHSLARAIADVGWGEFVRQLRYKGVWYGCAVIQADRFYPSSKTCSRCGRVKADLPLSERVFRCECGFECGRDLNAALNLEHWAAAALAKQETTASDAGSHACGERVSPGATQAVLVEAGTEHLLLAHR